MKATKARHQAELLRMYDKLETLEPGTDEYDAVLSAIMKAKSGENERYRIKAEQDTAKKDLVVKVGIFAGGLIVTPLIDLACKRNLAKFIGTVEQMETFTTSAGRSISSWFRMK